MIGILPKTLAVDDVAYPIRSDYRVALLIFEAYDSPDLDIIEKNEICLDSLYLDYKSIPDQKKAFEQAIWFLDGGDIEKKQVSDIKVMDWEQDEKIIFPAVNKVAGCEVRALDYMHWWTFLGFFGEIGEGLMSTVMHIRRKKAKGKKLDKYEQEIYRENKDLIVLKKKYTDDEQAEKERLKKELGFK